MSPRPLVLISGKDVLSDFGGHESYVRAHALAATQAGYEPHIFCVGAGSRTVRTEYGVVHRVGDPRIPVWLQVPLLACAVVRRVAPRPGPHLIHGFAIFSAAGALAGRLLGRRGAAAVVLASAYGTRAYEVGAMQRGLARHSLAHRLRYRAWLGWIRRVDDRIEGWGYIQSRLVFVNYVSVARLLNDAYGPRIRVRRLPYASAEAFAARPPLPAPEPVRALEAPHAPLIIAVSRHDPRKGIDLLLVALARLTAGGVEFRACLIGPGRLLAAHRRLATDLGLDRVVAIPGGVRDVRPYYACADIFVLPSLAEASGSVSILEALQFGTAIVASACDGIPEDLVDGRDALLVAPGDVTALASALSSLARDPARRAALAASARVAHAERFSAERFAPALISAYEEVGRAARDPRPSRTGGQPAAAL